MRNIHILKTDQRSRIGYYGDYRTTEFHILSNNNYIDNTKKNWNPQAIYITSDEEIKDGDWSISLPIREWTIPINRCNLNLFDIDKTKTKKIILTTDQDLIKDVVQSIPDDFLQWFARNPVCGFVDVQKDCCGQCDERLCEVRDLQREETKYNTFYKIIIPKEFDEKLDDVDINNIPINWSKHPSYKSQLANRLKNILDNMTQEQFDIEWKKITDLGLGTSIIIPKEEPKQDFPMQKLINIMENDEELKPKQILEKETLEEIAEKYYPAYPDGTITSEILTLREGFVKGARVFMLEGWNDEDMIEFGNFAKNYKSKKSVHEAFSQFKNK